MGRLLTRVHLTGPTSRATLTRDLGLNRSTIGDLTSSLVDLGLVTEAGTVSTHGNGRPSYVVQPRDDVTVIGVNLGVDRNTVASVGLGGEVLSRRERPHHRGEHDMLSVVESLAQMIEDAVREDPDRRCLGIGVAVPGAVGLRDGVVRFAPNLGWVNAPFAAALSSRLGMTVVCDNDAHLGARAEHLRGVAVGRDNIAYLAGSVGVGGGFIVGGQPLTGAQRLRRRDRAPVAGSRRSRVPVRERRLLRDQDQREPVADPGGSVARGVDRRPSRRSSEPLPPERSGLPRRSMTSPAGSPSVFGRSSTSSTPRWSSSGTRSHWSGRPARPRSARAWASCR